MHGHCGRLSNLQYFGGGAATSGCRVADNGSALNRFFWAHPSAQKQAKVRRHFFEIKCVSPEDLLLAL